MQGETRLDMRHWLSAARHPAGRTAVIAAALLVLPWAVALALVLRHQHLDSGAVGVLATASLGLPALWLGWAGYRVASRASPADSDAGPRVIGKPIRLADPPPLLSGRERLLTELAVRLTSGNDPGPRMVVLWGLAGAGKTSLALAYAQLHLAEVGVAWQFDCEDLAMLPNQFGKLADQLGVRHLLATPDWVATVHGVLAEYPDQWLLIFDNAQDMPSVAPFLPKAGPGRLVITSQNPNWPGQMLQVTELERNVAAVFLLKRTGYQDARAAAELARELGGLPLALEQAGAYMRATFATLPEYLELFQQHRPEMLGRGAPIGYSKTLATTWALAFDRLQQDTPGAVGLLQLMAFCAPDAIPLRLLLQPRPELVELPSQDVAPLLAPLLADWLAARDAIGDLRRYSLVTDAGDGAVSVHRLVQAVTVDQMPPELRDEWRQAAVALIEAAIPKDARQPQTWPVFELLRPHADRVLSPGSRGTGEIADYLGYRGNYADARDLQRRVLSEREQLLGPEHPSTLTARGNLARWTGWAGNAAQARAQLEGLLPVIQRVLGPEDPDTLAVRAELANWTRRAKRGGGHGHKHPATGATRADRPRRTGPARGPVLAAVHYAELLPLVERVLGPKHPLTLDVRVGLAWSNGEAGQPVEAHDQLNGLLPVVERVLGPEHPLTLNVRAGLARWIGSKTGLGDAASARDQFIALLPVYQRVLGPEHPDTLYIRHSVARWTGQAGDPTGARDQYKALLSVRERILGPDHPDTKVARNLLDHWTRQADSKAN